MSFLWAVSVKWQVQLETWPDIEIRSVILFLHVDVSYWWKFVQMVLSACNVTVRGDSAFSHGKAC